MKIYHIHQFINYCRAVNPAEKEEPFEKRNSLDAKLVLQGLLLRSLLLPILVFHHSFMISVNICVFYNFSVMLQGQVLLMIRTACHQIQGQSPNLRVDLAQHLLLMLVLFNTSQALEGRKMQQALDFQGSNKCKYYVISSKR